MFDLSKYGDGICLARMAELLEALAIDRARLQERSIAITGSNGKGSTAAFCASIGRAFGLRTGLFTSPHLFRINERFQIDGAPIEDIRLRELERTVMAVIDNISRRRGERFGAFEALFALACLFFQENDCELLVFEAGIGGRYDPVRLLGSRVAAVTSIDYEHVELLGNSLELIVSDKSDACASGGSIVYGENCRALRPHIGEYNRNRNVESLFVRDEVSINDQAVEAGSQRFDFVFRTFDFRALGVALPGGFQLNNAAIAATLFINWIERTRPRSPTADLEAAVRNGLRQARWPGRLEAIAQDPLTVIDVGHTPDGIKQSLAGLHATYGPNDWLLVAGVSLDKKAALIASALAPHFRTIICTAAHHKGGDATALASAMRLANPAAQIEIAATIEQAFASSRTLAAALNERIYVAGGLFTAIEYAAVARGLDASSLAFF
ncbi:MAG TPA: cyanophycin synthetase [Bradyrhizobium sp.]|uniref:bifunctional folylpolyglutamate synthase/dihydrofolate synthase n=1 Tax=Bradyrhizobium sp. TaxID=376 RepID=UPI002D80EF38|nr:cyanophycin synthetase [Bradyrhizobium sp.]HET7886462.1 cyanophycin synthetase [Bradyrhizobium sp.]